MTDNLEQLERDWPQPRPKDLSPRGTVNIFLALTVLLAVVAEMQVIMVILHLKSHHVELWYVKAFNLEMAVLIPGLAAIAFYRKVKAAVIASGSHRDLLLYIQFHGILALMLIYAAIGWTINVLDSVSDLIRMTLS
jgi:hypothetical protein